MPAKFVSIDHDSPLLLPPDLRDWLPPGHMVHFIMDAVDALDLSKARGNEEFAFGGRALKPPLDRSGGGRGLSLRLPEHGLGSSH